MKSNLVPCNMDAKNKAIAWDVLVGIIAATGSYFIFENFKLNIALILFSPLPLLAGFIRGKGPEKDRLMKLVCLNALFLVLVMAIMNGVFHLIPVLAFALIGSFLGIYARQYLATATLRIMGLLSLFFVSAIFMGLSILPSWLDSSMWEEVNKKAPEYNLVTLEGDTIRSSDLDGKVVVMDFWATWCKPCKIQFPIVEQLYKEYKGNESVVFLVINPLKGKETAEKAARYIADSNHDLPFVNDVKSLTYENLNVRALPHIVIIDSQGTIRFTHTGFNESENFYQKLDAILSGLTK